MATVSFEFDPFDAAMFTTVAPPVMTTDNGTNFPVTSLAFSGTAGVQAAFFKLKALNYGASNPNVTVLVDFFTSATTLNTVFQAALCVVATGAGQSMLTDAFATTVAATAVTSNTTANGPSIATITISGASLDSLAPGSNVHIKLLRDSGNAGDTNTADAKVYLVTVQYPDV